MQEEWVCGIAVDARLFEVDDRPFPSVDVEDGLRRRGVVRCVLIGFRHRLKESNSELGLPYLAFFAKLSSRYTLDFILREIADCNAFLVDDDSVCKEIEVEVVESILFAVIWQFMGICRGYV